MSTHRQKVPASEPVPATSSTVEGQPPQSSVPFSDFDVSIALHKGKWSCTDHLITHFVSHDRLTLSFHQFAMSLSSVTLPKSYEEAILIPTWKQAMMRRWMLLFLEELGIGLCTQRCELSMGLYLEVSP